MWSNSCNSNSNSNGKSDSIHTDNNIFPVLPVRAIAVV